MSRGGSPRSPSEYRERRRESNRGRAEVPALHRAACRPAGQISESRPGTVAERIRPLTQSSTPEHETNGHCSHVSPLVGLPRTGNNRGETPSSAKALVCTGVGVASMSTSVPPPAGPTRLRGRVDKSHSRVRRLWTGRSLFPFLEAAFLSAPSERWAGATTLLRRAGARRGKQRENSRGVSARIHRGDG